MKSKAQKQKDLESLTQQFQNANSAMVVGFKGMTVAKDQELRNQLREAGVSYEVVKNTLARKAAAGTPLEPAADQFKGVTAVALSKGEYALLLAFLEAPQRPLTREHLLQATRVHEDIFDRSIDVQVLRLRRKLETDPSAPRIIQTERGVGYVFALPVESF